jgi:hypothetical protein
VSQTIRMINPQRKRRFIGDPFLKVGWVHLIYTGSQPDRLQRDRHKVTDTTTGS